MTTKFPFFTEKKEKIWCSCNRVSYTVNRIDRIDFDTVVTAVTGLWQSGADGTDINGCAVNNEKSLLASADDFGKVNLYSYPSRLPYANAHSYNGHSSHVTAVRFTSNGQYLMSAGGKDATLLQWKVV